MRRSCGVSIHAPARGATLISFCNPIDGTGFNPRARTGRDNHAIRSRRARAVSIHAPARGATTAAQLKELFGEFQSTRPQGARPAARARGCCGACFNPRARRGRDCVLAGTRPLQPGFNPRARRGRDKTLMTAASCERCFNPRARRGRDTTIKLTKSRAESFNPRARTGRDIRHFPAYRRG